MKRRFDLKGWGPIIAAALLGFVLGTTGVSVLWPSMWEGARLSDTLGLWGGILGGFMTLIAAIIAFRPARDQMLIARIGALSAETRELSLISERLIDFSNYLSGLLDAADECFGDSKFNAARRLYVLHMSDDAPLKWQRIRASFYYYDHNKNIKDALENISLNVFDFKEVLFSTGTAINKDQYNTEVQQAHQLHDIMNVNIQQVYRGIEEIKYKISREMMMTNWQIGVLR